VSLPPATLIVCSRNRPEFLRDAIESVFKGTEVPAEIIVIDQSDDAHPALSARPARRGCTVRHINTPTRGASVARNLGIELAEHDLLVFADDDVLVADTWYAALVSALALSGAQTVVTGRVLPSEAEAAGAFQLTLKTDECEQRYTGRIGMDALCSINMAAPRSAFAEVGVFDERLGAGARFKAAEDNDLGYRLLEAGYAIQYVPEAVVYHRAWRPADQLVPLRFAYGYGMGALFAKHASLRDRYMLGRLREDAGRHAVRAVRYVLRRPRRKTIADLVYAAGILWGATRWWMGHGGSAP
jgi:GT2 family glycosyltransferase